MALDAATLSQAVVNGLVTGSVLALAAIGLTLVYGVLRLANFAHGDFLTLGAYLGFLFAVVLGSASLLLVAVAVILIANAAIALDIARVRRVHPVTRRILILVAAVTSVGAAGVLLSGQGRFLLAALLAVGVGALVAVATDPLIWAPLRRRRASLLTGVITSIGLALLIRHVLLIAFGSDPRSYSETVRLDWLVGPVRISPEKGLAVLVALALVVFMHVVLSRTRTGKAMRACADNLELARVVGIDTDRIIRYTWVISGALAGVAGLLLGLITNVNPNLGWAFILPTFAAVILGGIGSASGALLGAFLIGLAMEGTALFASQYKFAVAFVVLIATLLVRPQGILGVKA